MIKINLIKDKSAQKQAVGDDTINITDFDAGESSDQGDAAKKLLVIAIFPALIYAYQFYNVGGLNKEKKKIQRQVSQLSQQVADVKIKAEETKKKQLKIREIEQKIEFLKGLSQTRLLELRALDFFQGALPDLAWVNSVEIKNNKLNITGYASNDDVLDTLVKKLQSSSYFKDIVWRSNTETLKEGVFKSFAIDCSIGSAEKQGT